MSNTAFLYHPAFLKHRTGWNHPERRERLVRLVERLKQDGLWGKLIHIDPQPATPADVASVHNPDYVEAVRQSCESHRLFEPDESTVGSSGTYEAAMMAVGAVQAAVDAIMAGRVTNAFCAVRPPGHHAERNRTMGFCFFNNIAIAARHLQHVHGIRRIAIIDWDVHHGNGTQQAFYDDPSVLYFSIHQYPLYPRTGRASETGTGAGLGFTLNRPVPAGATDTDYLRIFMEDLKPAVARFSPEFILISAGFDAHASDPLGGVMLSTEGFGKLTQIVKAMAEEHCGGRLVSTLEGGYDLEALADSTEAHLRVLLGIEQSG
jgi:acetoin utilization deacetylase AcuC-like enzyme